MVKTIAAFFDDVEGAKRAAQTMRSMGFRAGDIRVGANVGPPSSERSATRLDPAERATGAAIGILCGGALGALAGAAITLLEIEFPGLKAIFEAGKIAPALSGAGVGAISGGLVGGLKDWAAKRTASAGHSEAGRCGAVVLTVSADAARVDEVEGILRSHGGNHIQRRVPQWNGPNGV